MNFAPSTYAELSSLFKLAEAKGKLKKLALPLLLALKFKSAVILPIVFAVLSLVSLKALKVGLVALILAGKTLYWNISQQFHIFSHHQAHNS